MAEVITGLAVLSLATWLYLLCFHGGFWRADQRLRPDQTEPGTWPEVVAVIPARNEATVIGRSLRSLLTQDYPGRLSVILVDDLSRDGTAELARNAAAETGRPERLTIVATDPLAPGWTGKLWSMAQGLRRAEEVAPEARYVWLTDADVEHEGTALRQLVAKAEAGGRDLVSLMVLLRSDGFWAGLLIPAFVFFFQKLYPFAHINDPAKRTAGAAGGCMLVRRSALKRIGGIESIRNQLIDDCALARALKPGGPIWLGLTEQSRGLRPYDGLGAIWHMVSRTAFTQLGHSPALLAATVLGMAVIYLVPPVAVFAGAAAGIREAALAGLAAWLIMAFAYLPTLRLYRRPAAAALALPLAGLLYALMTVDSAHRHWRGRGGGWKGRSYPTSLPAPGRATPTNGGRS